MLEYDDVMNKQRNVVYGKRNHALHGERLALDLDNSFLFLLPAGLIDSFRGTNDIEGFKLGVIVNFGMEDLHYGLMTWDGKKCRCFS